MIYTYLAHEPDFYILFKLKRFFFTIEFNKIE